MMGNNKIVDVKIPKGTIVKIEGLPFELVKTTVVRGTVGNFKLIKETQNALQER
jgi:hypothetical protein